MSDIFYDERVNLSNEQEGLEIRSFLARHNLVWEAADYTVRILNQSLQLVGTGSLANTVIKCVAVDSEYQGTAVFSKIITHLLEQLALQNSHHCFVFTKPASVQSFLNLGFQEIERAEPLIALLEYGIGGLASYKEYLKEHKIPSSSQNIGAVIVNCNPFTLGHRYLIETASMQCNFLYVIVVEEDRSAFPFKIRYDLVEKGVADLKNVQILRGDKFVVSSLTFPTYFLKNESVSNIGKLQAELDVKIFARHIATELGINYRFVGTEDYCETTATYNEAMQKILPDFGITHKIIKRKKIENDLIISASHVRKALKNDDWDLIKKLVPATTFNFLVGEEAQPIIEKLKTLDSRH